MLTIWQVSTAKQSAQAHAESPVVSRASWQKRDNVRKNNLGETREIVGKATKCEKCLEICAVCGGVGIPINCLQKLRLHVECVANNSNLKVSLWL